jgi:hypothetical protein
MSERIRINNLEVQLGDPYPRYIRIMSNDVTICFYGQTELALLIATLQDFQRIIQEDEAKQNET